MSESTLNLNCNRQTTSQSTQILLEKAGKKFNREWIFKNLHFIFKSGNAYAITGPNGSGKSTLLQVLAGSISLSAGTCSWLGPEAQKITEENVYQQISIAAPYLELIEEMTAMEFLSFHATFKPLLPGWNAEKVISHTGLHMAANKQIRYYSSGMKQRVKLAQAIFSDVPVLLLDEPCTNFDLAGFDLYNELITTHCSHKLVIVSSNDVNEYKFCNEKLNILDFK